MALLIALPNCGGDGEVVNPDAPTDQPNQPDDGDDNNEDNPNDDDPNDDKDEDDKPDEPLFVVSPASAEVVAAGGIVEFTLMHDAEKENVTVEIEEAAQRWISLIEPRAITTTYQFEVNQNPRMEPRTANITFTDNKHAKQQTVKITQVAAEEADDNPLAGMNCANNEILYITNNVNPINILRFEGLLSNTYEDGIGRLTFSSDLNTLPEGVFKNYSRIEYMLLPKSLKTIGKEAFAGCSNLKSITIPNSVTSIGEYAFSFCKALTSITIPDSVIEIEIAAFALCI